MNINVHVERLILDGLPVTSSQGSLVQAAVEAGLIRFLAEQGLLRPSSGAVQHVAAGCIQLTENSRPIQLGHQVAQAIYNGLALAPASPPLTGLVRGRRE